MVFISNIAIAFQIPIQKYRIEAILDLNLTFSYLTWKLHFGKFEGADFKYDNRFSNSGLKVHKYGIFGSKLDFFCFTWNFTLDKLESADFKYDNSLFQILS